MADIYVSKVSEAYVKVHSELAIKRELHEYFAFFAPNHQHSPKFKGHFWDGKIRLFSGATEQIYHGLVEKLVEFASSRGYSIELDPNITIPTEFSMHEAAEFANSLNVHSGGIPLKLDDYQIAALCYAVRNRRQFFICPTGGGKTVIDYLIVRYLSHNGLRGIVVCPDKGLIAQLHSDFKDYSSANGWDVDAHVHQVFEGQAKDSPKPVIVTTWQSAYKRDDEYFEQFNYVIGEEADTFKAKCLKTIGERLTRAFIRIGLTGSLDGEKVHELVLQGLFGPIKQLTTVKELQARGRLSGLRIKGILLRHPSWVINDIKKLRNKKVGDKKRGWSWDDEKKFVLHCAKRNKFIANLALSMTQSTLVLFENIEHGTAIYNTIQELAGDRKVFYVDGPAKGKFKTEGEYRNWVRAQVELCDNPIIVASRVFVRGINIKNLHNIIRASTDKAKAKNLQGIGRGLRALAGKTFMTLYEVVDDLRLKTWENHGIKHLQERLEIYNQEGFNYKLYNVALEYDRG